MQSPRVLSFENLRGFTTKMQCTKLALIDQITYKYKLHKEVKWQEEKENKKFMYTSAH